MSAAIISELVLGICRVGRTLSSEPILIDPKCSMFCIFMSGVLLASSLIYLLTGFGFADGLGAIGLIKSSYT
jgi:hypothetical protein